MPTIATPHTRSPYDAPIDDAHPRDSRTGRSHSLLLRTRVGIQHGDLTRALAEGADPGTRPELALRAAQLTGKRSRRTLARTLRRTIAEAHQPALTRARAVINPPRRGPGRRTRDHGDDRALGEPRAGLARRDGNRRAAAHQRRAQPAV
jgi:hypothetical protein